MLTNSGLKVDYTNSTWHRTNIYRSRDLAIGIELKEKTVWYNPTIPSPKYQIIYSPVRIQGIYNETYKLVTRMFSIYLYKKFMVICAFDNHEKLYPWEVEVLSQLIPLSEKKMKINRNDIWGYNPDIMYNLWKDCKGAKLALLGEKKSVIVKKKKFIIYLYGEREEVKIKEE